jgi:RimJ/RimL family protein N-acetyltransferase
VNVQPLYGLRLTTPRLELRLPTEDELAALFEAAERGIHPRETMPFYVPWTDDLRLEPFLDFHLGALRDWQVDAWNLNLVAFLDGAPIGSQGLSAREFPRRREVETGSWLEQAHQGRGLGTEQRAAVIELAFSRLGAVAITSGAMHDNAASRRVSEKLGYRPTHDDLASPRGVPVPHTHLRLRPEDFPGAKVTIQGVEPCLPLFGL